MSVEVTMPQMGADMTEGTLVKWLKKVGDRVERGEIIAEIETDKATVELEAFEPGVIRQLVVEEGETVPVGEVIALLGDETEALPEVHRMPPAEVPARRTHGQETAAAAVAGGGGAGGVDTLDVQAVAPAEAGTTTAPGTVHNGPGRTDATAGERLRISPVARRIAEDSGVDPRTLTGSGPDGRILRRDVEAAVGRAPAATPVPAPAAQPATERPAAAAPRATEPRPVEGLSRMRQAIARRMTQSKQQQPHYYLTLDIDMTAALAFREQVNASTSEEQRVSINDLIVKACALALQRHPKFNAEFSDQGLRMHADVNICIGIAMDEGLIAPAILNCEEKTLGLIARESKDLVARAKGGRLSAEEYSAGTFTITNLGNYGVETLIGIINPPQAAILGVGSVMAQPVVREGEIAVRQMMKVALSADHRVTDGAEGARFIKEIQSVLENPASLAL